MDVVCIGDVMLDVRADAGALARGGDVHGRVLVQPGGTSANAAVWASSSGAAASVIGAIGDDVAGDLLLAALAERGVGTDGVVRSAEPTGTMLVVHEAGERSMVADRGANASLVASDLPARIEAEAVLISGYLLLQPPTTGVAVAAIERADAAIVAVETASWPLVASFGVEAFFEATVSAGAVLANGREAAVLTGCDPDDACRKLGERFRIAAVKRGADGACLSVDGVFAASGSPVVEERDPTGAGDAFDGVLLASLARGSDARAALTAACAAGATVAASLSAWPERRRG
ncbi:MAG TPA: carbohydrate kinase family protein [Actinomycetota bacterium]|nr:carbohydrate kinase family protein [Actinomycetota bacterium]